MTACIRRAGATWTTCTCDPCVVRRRRIRKARDLGLLRPSPSEAAWVVLDELTGRGWNASAIASATGVSSDSLVRILYQDSLGHRINLTRPTAHAILTRLGRPTAGHVGVLGATRRLQALTAMGYTLPDMVTATGIPTMTLSCIRAAGVERTRPDHHYAIADAFTRLAMTPGPSTKARQLARARGWVTPLAWDDIDDPDEIPAGATAPTQGFDQVAVDLAVSGARTVTLTRPERHAAVTTLAAQGLNDRQIADRCGVAQETVLRDRQNLGIASPTKEAA